MIKEKPKTDNNKTPEAFVMMSHPANHKHPEALRILPIGEGEGGYVHFSTIKKQAWELTKNNPVVFRLYPHDGSIDTESIEALWERFAYPPKASIKLL